MRVMKKIKGEGCKWRTEVKKVSAGRKRKTETVPAVCLSNCLTNITHKSIKESTLTE